MPRLFCPAIVFSLSLVAMHCGGQNAAKAQEPFAVGWAWSAKEVESAGDSFWPQFRGPAGDGHAKQNANPPTKWSETENVRCAN